MVAEVEAALVEVGVSRQDVLTRVRKVAAGVAERGGVEVPSGP